MDFERMRNTNSWPHWLMGPLVLAIVSVSVGCERQPIEQPPAGNIELPTGVKFNKPSATVSRDSALNEWLLKNTERFYGSAIPDSAFEIIAAGIGARRIVMLGDEATAASQPSSLKVSLVRALHEQQGFNVLAFEGPMWTCASAHERTVTRMSSSWRDGCASDKWEAEEIAELFRYVESTERTSQPLALIGLDASDHVALANQSVHSPLVAQRDPRYAAEVRALDATIAELLAQDLTKPLGPRKPVPMGVVQGLDSLTRWFAGMAARETRDDLAARYALAGATSRTRAQVARVLSSFNGKVREIEDDVMAENLAFIADTLYPSQKIIVWSRNARIMRNRPGAGYGAIRQNMGALFERASPQNTPYAIALFAVDRGASGKRSTAALSPPPIGNLKELLQDEFGRTVLLTTNPGGTTIGTQWLSRDVIAGRRDQQRRNLQMLDDYDAVLVRSYVTAATSEQR